MSVPLRVTFDRRSNAAYIHLRAIEPGGVAKTLRIDEVSGIVNLDLDTRGRLIGIEVLPATRLLPEEVLEQAERI